MGRTSSFPITPGMRFGKLTVVGPAKSQRQGRWVCQCTCGEITQLHAADLQRGKIKSCGCIFRGRAAKDLTGLRFGRLSVIGRAKALPSGNTRYECQCDCGNFSQPSAYDLRNGKTQSCGCLRNETTGERSAKSITGQRFGRLVALHRTGESRDGQVMWRLRCDCGKEIEHSLSNLGKRVRSCGCLHHERCYRHGGARTALYECWRNMKSRCLNPNQPGFKYWGGRGITIAPEWIDDFIAFKDYVDRNLGPKPSPRHSIDRIENYEGYFPGNLRWATGTVQNHNSRQSRIEKAVNTILNECVTGL